MTLNVVMTITLHYFTGFGKHALQHNRVDLWRNVCPSLLYCMCTMSSSRKFTFAVSYPDKFLVISVSLLFRGGVLG